MPTKTPLIPISIILILLFIPILATAQTSDNGLVAEWHFDEGKGNIVKDTSGNGNDGTIHGATWVDGKYGKALSFDGKNDYVEVPDDESLRLWNSYTLEAWINMKGMSSYGVIVAKRSGSTVNFNYHISDAANDRKMASYNGATSVGGTTVLNFNQWYHVAYVYDSGIIYFYLNGQFDGSASQTSGDANEHSVFIGTDNGGTKYYFNGIIDEIRIYNRALSAEEIKAHYEGIQTSLTITKSLSTSTLQEGTQSTVTLTIKNTGSTPISNLKITDSLPSAFKLISGTLTKSIPSLTAEQSTTLTYTIEPYGIGTINLPEATATYQDQKGKSY
ncbi:MAG: LamG-like jellyroll fold domain-containing protein, partial [Methanosarcinales archaeon]